MKKREKLIKEAQKMGEERLITFIILNGVVPMTILGLITNVIPFALIVMPIEN